MENFTNTKTKTGYIITRVKETLQFYTEAGIYWTDDASNPNIKVYADKPLSFFENYWGYKLQDIDPTAKWVRATKTVVHTIEIEGE